MKNFTDWLKDWEVKLKAINEEEEILPEGLHGSKDTQYYAYCVSCGNDFEVDYYDGTPNSFDPNMAYCGSGPPKNCLP